MRHKSILYVIFLIILLFKKPELKKKVNFSHALFLNIIMLSVCYITDSLSSLGQLISSSVH